MQSQEIFKQRRQQLAQQMGQKSALVLASGHELIRNGDSHYPFRQDSYFYYLTGFNEPDAVAVLLPAQHGFEYILFNRPRDPNMEMWVGPRAGQAGACQTFGADQSYPIEELEKRLPELFSGCDSIYCSIGRNKRFDKILFRAVNQLRGKVRSGVSAPQQFIDVSLSLDEMRLIKSNAEADVMRKAAKISALAHVKAMQQVKPGMFEYQLQAIVEHEFLQQGAQQLAYNSIVGAGNNACILHYINNHSKINAGDLVLIDAGCEFELYASDITRTFPANGKFSAEQKAIYELVLRAQMEVIRQIKVGLPWIELQKLSDRLITEGLVTLKILKGNIADLIAQDACREYYPHRIGHWLGLDVHDAGAYKPKNHWRELSPGMVFTVEPGIYIPAGSRCDEKWWRIGVRIEDDILVTQTGAEVLTKDVPKQVADIENLMAQSDD